VFNAANSHLEQGGGVCGAIFATAGADKLQAEERTHVKEKGLKVF